LSKSKVKNQTNTIRFKKKKRKKKKEEKKVNNQNETLNYDKSTN